MTVPSKICQDLYHIRILPKVMEGLASVASQRVKSVRHGRQTFAATGLQTRQESQHSEPESKWIMP